MKLFRINWRVSVSAQISIILESLYSVSRTSSEKVDKPFFFLSWVGSETIVLIHRDGYETNLPRGGI